MLAYHDRRLVDNLDDLVFELIKLRLVADIARRNPSRRIGRSPLLDILGVYPLAEELAPFKIADEELDDFVS